MARFFPDNKNQSKLFDTDPEPVVEVEERGSKTRGEYSHDDILVRWSQEATEAPSGPSEYICRVARFKNGKRGIQLVRGEGKNPSFASTLTLHPDEYYSLAQCIFRDSKLIQKLCETHPDGTDGLVDKIRDFCKPSNVTNI